MTARAAERWFLQRGLPAALTARARSRDLLPRSAPALAAYAIVMVALLVVYAVTGSSEIYIDGAPTPAEKVVLTVIALVIPVAALAAWAVSRLRSRRAQSVAGIAAVAVAGVAAVIQGGPSHVLAGAIVIVIVAVLVGSGVGAVLLWAVRLTLDQAAVMGGLFVRSLPVVLLTVVVFFNTYVWIMSATISRTRLWVALLFLLAVTAAFLVSVSRTRAGPMLQSVIEPHDTAHTLSGTPFATMPDPPANDPLTRAERLNVIVVLAAAQFAHLMMVAICTAAIFFVLGLILLSPELLAKWTGNGPSDGTVLGMTIPVPQSLIQMTLILCVLTFMYVSARSVGDEEFKKEFLGPLIEDLHVTLIARNRYRG